MSRLCVLCFCSTRNFLLVPKSVTHLVSVHGWHFSVRGRCVTTHALGKISVRIASMLRGIFVYCLLVCFCM
jgi:hypothetical protein